MGYVIPLCEPTTLPVVGSGDGFPVRRIFCVGRNYAAHAREMGHDPDREPPFFFTKPANAVVPSGATIPYPVRTSDLHYEIELVVALSKGGVDIGEANALDHVYGYGVGIDLTRRDLQGEAKKMGRPWDMGKGFDNSAPMTALTPASAIGHPAKGEIWLKVNGETRQKGDLAQQIWNVQETISYLSGLVTLYPGDLIMTGTPEGVGPVVAGDRLVGGIDGLSELTVSIG
ncbi:fumarylacetoacetate hydrolase family protein [Inquilinus sp. CAU 1745]|uniref:fumarylacetoacetate hydrolase family protein n=1 Tax=Inquilinus sp. CAU 1745 TaxID=3140369 RepID=UPI00325B4FB3